jgi:hypothetical protein
VVGPNWATYLSPPEFVCDTAGFIYTDHPSKDPRAHAYSEFPVINVVIYCQRRNKERIPTLDLNLYKMCRVETILNDKEVWLRWEAVAAQLQPNAEIAAQVVDSLFPHDDAVATPAAPANATPVEEH